jgi:hypothetical protein
MKVNFTMDLRNTRRRPWRDFWEDSIWDFYRKIRLEMGDPELGYGLAPSPESYRDNELIGPADDILTTLRPLATSARLTDIIYSGPAGGVDLRTEAYDDLKRFAEEVLPTLRSW